MSLPLKLFPVLLLACSASAGSQGTFAGRLVDAETGKPISSARGLRKANGRNEKHSRHSRASRGRQGEVSLPMSAAPDAQGTRPTHSCPSGFSKAARRSSLVSSRFASTKQPLTAPGVGQEPSLAKVRCGQCGSEGNFATSNAPALSRLIPIRQPDLPTCSH